MQVSVRDNNVEQAQRVLRKKLQREGTYREQKQRKFYEKPSLRRARRRAECQRRYRRALARRLERYGY